MKGYCRHSIATNLKQTSPQPSQSNDNPRCQNSQCNSAPADSRSRIRARDVRKDHRVPPGLNHWQNQADRKHQVAVNKLCLRMPNTAEYGRPPARQPQETRSQTPAQPMTRGCCLAISGKSFLPCPFFEKLLLPEQPANFFELITVVAHVLDKVYQQRPGGSVEYSLHKFLDHDADNLCFRFYGLINKGPPLLGFSQTPFLLQRSHH